MRLIAIPKKYIWYVRSMLLTRIIKRILIPHKIIIMTNAIYHIVIKCNISIVLGKCKPACKRGGVCTGDNRCRCAAGYDGVLCGKSKYFFQFKMHFHCKKSQFRLYHNKLFDISFIKQCSFLEWRVLYKKFLFCPQF